MSSSAALYYYKETTGSVPLIDLFETGESLVLKIDLPGVAPEDVLIKVYDDTLLIEGIRRKEEEKRGAHFLCMERSFESFRRIVSLPVPVNAMAGRASYRDGVITVTFPKISNRVIKIRIEK